MAPISPLRELDRRVSGGLDVRLCWSPHDDEIFVALTDHKTGDAFEVDVHRDESALDVFQHPYAFAAMPGRRRDSTPAEGTPLGAGDTRGSRRWPALVPARRARAL